MNILIKATVVAVVLSLTTLYANDGHNHTEHDNNAHKHSHNSHQIGISNTAVKKIAIAEVKRLALAKKIPKSWKSIPVSKIGKTHYGDTNDWVVGFDNPKIKDSTKQTLYIFVSIHGKIMGANYSGD